LEAGPLLARGPHWLVFHEKTCQELPVLRLAGEAIFFYRSYYL
jgi:hypothetical protein